MNYQEFLHNFEDSGYKDELDYMDQLLFNKTIDQSNHDMLASVLFALTKIAGV